MQAKPNKFPNLVVFEQLCRLRFHFPAENYVFFVIY